MDTISRRKFVTRAGVAGTGGAAAALIGIQGKAEPSEGLGEENTSVPLNGIWEFRLDADKEGDAGGWERGTVPASGWSRVTVPHTWQISAESAGHFGVAWYRRAFEAPPSWSVKAVRIEFEAVYHTATVWLNGQKVGEHLRKGYTAFTCDLSPALQPGRENLIVVRVENFFDDRMLPRGTSYDWTPDGGITRPVSLLITPRTYIERVDVNAEPDLAKGSAAIDVRCVLRNAGVRSKQVTLACSIMEEDSGKTVARQPQSAPITLGPGETKEISLAQTLIAGARLWHFDRPWLYRLRAEMQASGAPLHSGEVTFGIRKFEVRGPAFYLNGDRVWLMGVERMAGSHPSFGMAEPASLIDHDHRDMSELNCVFTRVHWQQDRRVLDYCDRNGILLQVEVPTWGPDTFKGMQGEPALEIMRNALEQLKEMIDRDRNHPSIIAWGLCNEIGGQNPAAYKFAQRMYEEAGRLDPHRLRSYASNSLQKDAKKDVAALMDFIEWNEYYESWYGGTVENVRTNLTEIRGAFPDKPIVISEYGYCECAADRKPGDALRVSVLRRHNEVFREFDCVGGAIFFCYNDYRTHIGDKGLGPLKQRVHGVVDLYGERKPSFAALRQESSPVEMLEIKANGAAVDVTLRTRKRLPAYRLEGYTLRWIAYGYEDLPMEQGEAPLPSLAPGDAFTISLTLREKSPKHIRVDVIRPTGFSVRTAAVVP